MTTLEDAVREALRGRPVRPEHMTLAVRVLVRALRDDDRMRDGMPAGIEEAVNHVADWIFGAAAADEPWMLRTNGDGIPLKLAKIGSLDRAVREADKAMLRFASSQNGADGEGEVPWRELGDGWTLVRLVSETALDRESGRMQHCIGQGYYDAAMSDGSRIYLSLRDKAGRPHATLEIRTEDRMLLQFQGKQNKPPQERYVEAASDFVFFETVVDNRLATQFGRVFDAKGVCHLLSDPPDDLHVASAVAFHASRTGRMPRRSLVVERKLYLNGVPGESFAMPLSTRAKEVVCSPGISISFPEGAVLEVDELHLGGAVLDGLPKNLAVLGSMDLRKSTGVVLPEGLTVDGMLWLGGSDATAIPRGCRVGSLKLEGSAVEELPDDLEVGNLDCGPVRRLPGSIHVRGNVHVGGRNLASVGDGFGCGGHLLLVDVLPELHLPENLEVGGDLTIAQGGPETLPEGLVVGGSLKLEEASTLRLPDRMSIGRDLVIEDCRLAVLPDGLRIGRKLEIDGEAITTIGAGTTVGGDLLLTRSSVRTLPPGLSIGGDLVVGAGCPLRIARDTVVGDTVFAESETILPDGFEAKGIDFSGGWLCRLPRGLVVEELLDLRDVVVEDLPEDLVVRGTTMLPEEFEGRPLPPGVDRGRTTFGNTAPSSMVVLDRVRPAGTERAA